MVKTTVIEKPFLNFNGRLSEGVTYNPENNTLLWVDIIAGEVHRVKLLDESKTDYSEAELAKISSTHEVFQTPGSVGVIGLTKDENKILCGCEKGMGVLDLTSNSFNYTVEFDPSGHDATLRSNDGTVDNQGNFWIGTMSNFDQNGVKPVGTLYRINKNKSIDTIFTECQIPNGLAFSNDSKKMFWIDSLTFTVWKFDYDAQTGEVSNKEKHIYLKDVFPDAESPEPDGFTMTSNGHIFQAVWSTSKVVHFDENGKVVEFFQFPAERISCTTFGGVDGDELFVTTGDLHLDEPSKVGSVASDLGGSIFRVKVAGVVPQVKNQWGGEI